MSVRGVRVINGKEPLLRQVVFEVRYNYGYNYLDRCGKILNRISREHGEWVVGNQINPQNAPLYSLRNQCKLVFGPLAINFDLNRTNSESIIFDEDINDFAVQCEEMTTIITDELELKEFTRTGFRAWYHFPFETKLEADQWLKELGIVSLSSELVSQYGGEFQSMALAVFISGKEHRFRIGFEAVETNTNFQTGPEMVSLRTSMLRGASRDYLRQHLKDRRRLQINTKYAAVVDFDSFQEDPFSIDPRDFITRNFSLFLDRMYDVQASIKKNADKKG